ncbi:hypothetical protein QBC39DRAFT_384526 [Podospora conica]|nr:hypothetical protein QBC39DRAFT_384526 [Schizothecium conicum]
MQLLTLLPLAATSVLGGVLPRDTPPGIYEIRTVNGTELAPVKIGDIYHGPIIESLAARGSEGLSKRDSNGGTGRVFPNQGDYNACTNTWRAYLQGGGKVNGKTKHVVRNGIAEIVGCNYNNEQWAPPPQTVDQFNAVMDNSYGAWNTGWVYSDAYHWTFWRDLTGQVNYCSNI